MGGVWFGMTWHGVLKGYGMAWQSRGMTMHGKRWFGMVGVWYGIAGVWYGIWHIMVVVWFGMAGVWHGMTW